METTLTMAPAMIMVGNAFGDFRELVKQGNMYDTKIKLGAWLLADLPDKANQLKSGRAALTLIHFWHN
ncbi:MAG: hypothetical protein WAW39_20465 [Prosthecobacter sp.]|uniref:hypothetical protein n=1 Tax=Prosthecobacter sp. TaxID=1965333 RepID=UPI003BAFCF58